jgi:hypothetical protein
MFLTKIEYVISRASRCGCAARRRFPFVSSACHRISSLRGSVIAASSWRKGFLVMQMKRRIDAPLPVASVASPDSRPIGFLRESVSRVYPPHRERSCRSRATLKSRRRPVHNRPMRSEYYLDNTRASWPPIGANPRTVVSYAYLHA